MKRRLLKTLWTLGLTFLVIGILGGFAELCIPFDAQVSVMPLVSLSGFSGLLMAGTSSICLWMMQVSGTTFRIATLGATTFLFLIGQTVPAIQ